MICRHKYEKREKDGYQYCSKCGKGRKLPCVHKWKYMGFNSIEGMDVFGKCSIIGAIRIYECEFCGEMKKKR